MQQCDIGMIGLGTMGRNLVLNIGDKGFSAVGYDKDFNKLKLLEKEAKDRKILAAKSLEEFFGMLKKPRAFMMLVPAGAAVDAIIEEALPYMEKGDIIIDGGNSHYTDTERRIKDLEGRGIHFMGVGISGGEQGARLGPSMMPGGSPEAYSRLKNIFEAVAAKADNEPCVAYMGRGSAGHYVKMVHNGIEYALIQLISESYHLMKTSLGLSNDELAGTFEKWDKEELHSFLIEITGRIFRMEEMEQEGRGKTGDKNRRRLIDLILDRARQKGTGKWTSQDAMDIQVPVPTIDAAVVMRDLSADRDTRLKYSKVLHGPAYSYKGSRDEFIQRLKNALYFSMIISYAQGMDLLKKASESYSYGVDLKKVASIWRGGCIIRASLLQDILEAYGKEENMHSLMASGKFSGMLNRMQEDIRFVVINAVTLGIPIPAFSASLSYFDSYRSQWLPANLVQAQRDFFGAHTYERIDKEGIFHTEWLKGEK
ncbi:MAG: NADP-dependent phosphogluconate dehydrogenase [Bacteroidota bacterium]|nr:NADP-dependent phosphogluconate dehydrogenase [Ignavibacteria bacterium]HEX2961948.1 NADP-dependent phosphogluconate dehydrogenase [Ignavibacteriales bacterium]MCU7500597.1 NADP-dependent phosphogluconate dehydrogenase [Ignavibacteria bacterium]MCU7514002.1 NADP-dependent phosphogluconate dehydrogenase [Ignavibacteria bacterium]MCU7521270.1 NADP-dependent phosphogluconate dehydrogenase [Ignavibacteria bacterium]